MNWPFLESTAKNKTSDWFVEAET